MADNDPRDPPLSRKAAGPPVHPVHQPKDKSAKLLYREKRIVADVLAKHVLGKRVPAEIADRIDLEGFQPGPTEHVDPKRRTSRHADLVWRAPFRDSWLYIVFVFEFQSASDWRMPVRVLLETALVYDYLSRDERAKRGRKLPPVLPVVVHVGTEPWEESMRLEDLLADEAQAFLPFAMGQEAVLVSEAAEAGELEGVETAREAALKLRYTVDSTEFQEAVAVLKALLPRDSVAREGLLAWVRRSVIESGAKEEDVAKLRELDDLREPVVDTWLSKKYRETIRKGLEDGRARGLEKGRARGLEEGRARGLEEGRREAEARARQDHRATLAGQAQRKFGVETAKGLATLLEGVSSLERLAEIANLIIDCASGEELLSRAAETS